MGELVPDRGDRAVIAHRGPVDGDEPEGRLEERDRVLPDEGRTRARVPEDTHEPLGVALRAGEDVDHGPRGEVSLKLGLHGCHVGRDGRVHRLGIVARKARFDSQVAASANERE